MTGAPTAPAAAPPQPGVPKVVRLLAGSAGLVAANLHYNQPLLPLIAASLAVSPQVLGVLPAVTQLGFAVSLLVLLPLADSLDRRRLVLATVAVAAVALLAQAAAPSLGVLLVAAFVVGAASVAPQILSPVAAAIAPAGREAQASGLVLSGILLGVLVSKVLAGLVGAVAGWQWLYVGASAAMLVVLVVLARVLPRHPPGPPQRLVELFTSPLVLLRAHPVLRLHAGLGALVSAAFMLFWSTYALQLYDEFSLGALAAGLFGIAGIAGSLLAPLAGRAVDRGRARLVLVVAAALICSSFGLLWLGGGSLVALVLGVVLLDAGVGAAHSTNQGRVFRIDPTKRGRLNSVYMFSYFIGGAAGSTAGVFAYGLVGWSGVCAMGLVAGAVVLALATTQRRTLSAGQFPGSTGGRRTSDSPSHPAR